MWGCGEEFGLFVCSFGDFGYCCCGESDWCDFGWSFVGDFGGGGVFG